MPAPVQPDPSPRVAAPDPVTVPLFARLRALGADSFLGKGFLAKLPTTRGGALA